MKIFKDAGKIQRHIAQLKRKGNKISFVPTMGALHEGHASLLRKARCAGDILVLSVFVNPLQFGPKEDFPKYPRTFKKDSSIAKKEGVDIIFAPDHGDLYTAGFSTVVEENALSQGLCGDFRPGHFKGVTTVVAKLFNIVMPDTAFFGQKDYQQFKVIERMVRDLNFSVKLVMVPTVRDKDGLALSSRNAYLSLAERKTAVLINRALREAGSAVKEGVSGDKAERKIREVLKKAGIKKIDYIKVVDADDLKSPIGKNVLISAAVWVGKTRLIDNVIVRKP